MKGGGFASTLALALVMVVLAVALGLGIAWYGEGIPLIRSLLPERSVETTSTPVMVNSIQRLNELSTVRWTESLIITKETEGGVLPDFLAGEKVLLVASGEVEAGVNLDELSRDDVRVEGER